MAGDPAQGRRPRARIVHGAPKPAPACPFRGRGPAPITGPDPEPRVPESQGSKEPFLWVILPLINALVTEHKYMVQQGGPPGSMSATFSPNGGPGAGGMSMGSKAQLIKKKQENSSVRGALTTLHPGVNFGYDIEAWRGWYIKNQTSTSADLRRDN